MSNWFIIIHILGAVQGVFLAAILLSKQRGSVANRVLAILMLAFALDLATAAYHATGYDEEFPHLIGIDYPLAFLYGPLLYLYAKTLSRRERAFRKSYLWHVLPFALLMLSLVPFYLQSGAEKLAFLHNPESDLWTQPLGIVNHFKLVHALVYIGMTLALLKRHRREIKDTFSSTERINLVWLRNLMIGIIALVCVAVALYLLALRDPGPVMGLDSATVYDDYTLLSLALFIYAIGFMGLRQPDVFNGRRYEQRMQEDSRAGSADESDDPDEPDEPDEPDRPQYAKSGMNPETARRYRRELLDLMNTEKPYRNGDPTLQDLADALSISAHNLTEVINTQLGQNFYDFVNGYRVREVKKRLVDPEYAHLTLLAIGMEAGFNSKSAFNAVFKKHTGMTPSQYRAQARKPSVS